MPYYYTTRFNWQEIHWACIECLVRPMCNERCSRTYYKHYLCEPCNDCEGYPCKLVEKAQMYECIQIAYGDKLFKYYDEHLKQTSIFRFLKRPLESPVLPLPSKQTP